MEETPEEILARLQRYVDSLKQRDEFAPGSAPVTPTATPPAVARVSQPPPGAVLTLEPPESALSLDTVRRTILGQVIWVTTCIITLLWWVNVNRAFTYVVVITAAVLAGIGMARRVPFSGWVLIGLVSGLGLGRFS